MQRQRAGMLTLFMQTTFPKMAGAAGLARRLQHFYKAGDGGERLWVQ
jgi:hypothetical protein